MSRRSTHRTGPTWRSKTVRAAAIAALAFAVVEAASRDGRKPSFRNALKRFNRRWFNPLMLRFAGRRPWPMARLEHRGRRSGMRRTTPLLAWPVAGGFILPMPYGTDVDWAKNLLQAGQGVLQHQGVRYRVGAPRIAPSRAIRDDLPFPIGALANGAAIPQVMRVDLLPSVTPEVSLPA